MARYREARAYLEESLRIARDNGDYRMVAGILHVLALATFGEGDVAAARVQCEEALTIARDLGDERRIAMASNGLGHLHRLEGRLDEAERNYRVAEAISRKVGDREMEATVLLNLAIVAIGKADDRRAASLLQDVLGIAAESGSHQALQGAFDVAAGLAASRGDWERAARLHGLAEHHMHETGLRRDPADAAFLAPWIARTREALGQDDFARHATAGRQVAFTRANAEARTWLAEAG
jgi:tetratricopeptide (TPR) repeat protein